MNKKFKFVALLMTLLIFATSCSHSGANNSEENDNAGVGKEVLNKYFNGKLEEGATIKVLENDTAIAKGYFKELLEAFNKAYADKGIKAVDANVDQNIDLANDGPYGYGPDVLYQANDVLMQYSRAKHILPLPIEDIEAMKTTAKEALEAFSINVDGHKFYVGVPINVQAPMLYYRKDLLPKDWQNTWDENQNKIPDMLESWPKMYEFSKSRKQAGKYGYMQSLNNVYFSSGFLFSYGAYIFGNNNTDVKDIGFAKGDSAKGANIIQQLASNMNEEAIDDTITTNAYSELARGNYFATISTPDVYSTFVEELYLAYKNQGLKEEEAREKAKENLIMIKLPKLPLSGNLEDKKGELIDTKSMGGINGYSISSYTKVPNASLEFIKFATKYENIKRRHELLGIAPTRKDLASEIGGNSETLLKRLENNEIVLMPSIPELSQMWIPMGTYLADIVKDVFRPQKDKNYQGSEDLKKGLEAVSKQIYDAIHTLN